MKKVIQRFLRKAGLYDRLKTSCLYDVYWDIADPCVIGNLRNEVAFYRRQLTKRPGRNLLIFDIGANMGQKTDVFLRIGAQVVAVDPDCANIDTLKRRFLEWRLRPRPVVLVPGAVSASVGKATYWIESEGGAKNTLSEKWVNTLQKDSVRFNGVLDFAKQKSIETTTLDKLIAQFGLPDFVKIDVEGHEAEVLNGLTRPVPHGSFEVNLPEFLEEAIACVHRLASLDAVCLFNISKDCTRWLGNGEWKPMEAFVPVLQACTETSIEVFWKSPNAMRRD
jgi:FkbM family methyltransferase